MTQCSIHPQILQATPTGVPESLRVALGLAVVLIALITVLHGAGFGYV